MSPCLGIGIGMAYVPAERAEPGDAPRDRRARQARAAAVVADASPLLPTARRTTDGRRAATPTTSSTTPSTTGRGSTATSPTFGITWFAQDALGEVVFFDPPAVGIDGRRRTSPTPRSSRSRPSRDVIAPLSGEIVEVNEALGDTPEAINDDPYGEGWMVKVRL